MLVVDNLHAVSLHRLQVCQLIPFILLLHNVLCAPAYNYLDPLKLNSVHKLTNLKEAGYVQEIRKTQSSY